MHARYSLLVWRHLQCRLSALHLYTLCRYSFSIKYSMGLHKYLFLHDMFLIKMFNSLRDVHGLLLSNSLQMYVQLSILWNQMILPLVVATSPSWHIVVDIFRIGQCHIYVDTINSSICTCILWWLAHGDDTFWFVVLLCPLRDFLMSF